MASSGMNFVQWHWNPVEGATGYDSQFSTDEAFTGAETTARTAEQTSYLSENLDPETNYYLRVRSVMGTGGGRVTSDWSMPASATTTSPAARREVPHVPLDVSRQQLERLFDEIIDKTERREAFSEVKENAMNFSALEEMKALREEFIASTSEAELWYALLKLCNARRDTHLSISAVDGGLEAPDLPWHRERVPVAVLPDYSDIQNPSFFIAAVRGVSSPERGDRIIAVNGRTIAEHVADFTPWTRHSTLHYLYWRMADLFPYLSPTVPGHLYAEAMTLALETSAGNRYEVTLEYGDTGVGALRRDYSGFTSVMERENFQLLLNRDQQLVLLRWLDFDRSYLIEDVADLLEYAQLEQILDYDMIIDVTSSGGGSWGAFVIQRLVDRSFRTTFGNVRLSDAGRARIRRYWDRRPDYGQPDVFGLNLSGSWLIEWARTDARTAMGRGDEYTAPVPFKLAHLPKDSDGILHPAPVHFRGRVAIVTLPNSGSHLDQFVAMFADNDLAVVVGMPTGGFSNTWEHEEVLTVPGTSQRLVEFMWSIGHTIRPNGRGSRREPRVAQGLHPAHARQLPGLPPDPA